MNTATLSRPATRPTTLGRLPALVAAALERLADPFALATRLYVSWQFLKSGLLKIGSWETTLGLFREEYHVPLLPPALAAVVGTAGELVFPVLVALGLFGRLGAVGLFAVNALAVVSYAHVLYSEGFEAAIGQHYLWGFMLAMLAIYGPGGWSVDRWLAPRLGSPRAW
jgi:putative oxidoreductase